MKSEGRRATAEVPGPGPGASLSLPDTAPQGSSGYLLLLPANLFLAAPSAASSQIKQSLMRETTPQQNQQLVVSFLLFFFFCATQHVVLGSPTKDRIRAPYSGSRILTTGPPESSL